MAAVHDRMMDEMRQPQTIAQEVIQPLRVRTGWLVIEGHIKPFVRPNKRFSKKPADKRQYAEYQASKQWINVNARNAVMEGSKYRAIPARTPFWVMIDLNLEKLFIGDLDNMVKTIMDGLEGAFFPDDRYLVELYTLKRRDKNAPLCFVEVGTYTEDIVKHPDKLLAYRDHLWGDFTA